jgi:hypothetical protein
MESALLTEQTAVDFPRWLFSRFMMPLCRLSIPKRARSVRDRMGDRHSMMAGHEKRIGEETSSVSCIALDGMIACHVR